MINPKSKRDRDILQFLQANLSNKYEIEYKHYSIPLEWFNLKIDFIISLKEEFLQDINRPVVYYIQNGQNASMKKMVQIYDLLLTFTSVTIIWDEEDIKEKLIPLTTMLNSIIVIHKDEIISSNLNFLMFCDSQNIEEMDMYAMQVYDFNRALCELEKEHGIEYDEVEEEDDEQEL